MELYKINKRELINIIVPMFLHIFHQNMNINQINIILKKLNSIIILEDSVKRNSFVYSNIK